MRCGFDDRRALQLDHIWGGGTKDRRRLRPNGVYREALRMIESGTVAQKYQLLCANCNWIKRFEKGEH